MLSATAKIASIACAAAILSSCSSFHVINAPTRPETNVILQSYHEMMAATTEKPAEAKKIPPDPISPASYVRAGYRYVDLQCDGFFDQLANESRAFSFTKKETVAGISGLSATLALAKASATALALVATGGAFLSTTIDNAEDFAVLTKYQAQLKTLVDADRAQYKARNKPESVGEIFAADDWVRGYANRCTISTIEQEIAQTLATTVPVDKKVTVTAVSAIAPAIQASLSYPTVPTDVELKHLHDLLSGAASARVAVSSTDKIGAAAASKHYWDGAGALSSDATNIKGLLDNALVVDGALEANKATVPTEPQKAALTAAVKLVVKDDAQAAAIVKQVGTAESADNLGSSTPVQVRSNAQ